MSRQNIRASESGQKGFSSGGRCYRQGNHSASRAGASTANGLAMEEAMKNSIEGVRTEGYARAVTWTPARRLAAIVGAALIAALPVASATATGESDSGSGTTVTVVQSSPVVAATLRKIGPIADRGSTWT